MLSIIALSSDENELLENNYISTNHPVCKDLCLDFYVNEKPYIGLHLKISHNLLISEFACGKGKCGCPLSTLRGKNIYTNYCS